MKFNVNVFQLLYSLDEDDSNVHTNTNTPKMSKPASPSSFLPSSNHQLHNESEVDGLIRRSNSASNHTSNSQKVSADTHGGPESEVEQPLLNKSSNS